MNDNKCESICKYFIVHDQNINNYFNDAKVWILCEQHNNELHALKNTWFIDNFCTEDDIILIESGHNDYHLIERKLSHRMKYLNIDGWDDVYPEIYYYYKNFLIKIILYINHIRLNNFDDENWIPDIYILLGFIKKFDDLNSDEMDNNPAQRNKIQDNISIDDLITNYSFYFKINNLSKKSKEFRIAVFNYVIAILYEHISVGIMEHILNNLAIRNRRMTSVIQKYLDMNIYRKIIVITGVTHITEEYTNCKGDKVKNGNRVIKDYIKNKPHIILYPNNTHISYAIESINFHRKDIENRYYSQKNNNQNCQIDDKSNQYCNFVIYVSLSIILGLILPNEWDIYYVIIFISLILIFYYYNLTNYPIENDSNRIDELSILLNLLDFSQLLDVIKDFSNDVNISSQNIIIKYNLHLYFKNIY